MVAEVKQVKAPLLAQQDDDGAACPIQAVTEALPGGREGKRGEAEKKGCLQSRGVQLSSGPALGIRPFLCGYLVVPRDSGYTMSPFNRRGVWSPRKQQSAWRKR